MEQRTLKVFIACALGAVVGGFVGFRMANMWWHHSSFVVLSLLFGGPLIGAMIGGFAGVANYEIISKRVLNLIPR